VKTVEELYSEAQATIAKLNTDAEARLALLTESQAKVASLTKDNEALSKNNESLTLAHTELKHNAMS